MNKLEAKSLIFKLESGLISPDLNKQEQKIYTSWKKTTGYFNSLSRKLNKINLSEEKYLIGELNSKIQIAELGEKIKYCIKNGHTPKKNFGYTTSGQSGTRAHKKCKRCGMLYDRTLTTKEFEDFDKSMRTPMTI